MEMVRSQAERGGEDIGETDDLAILPCLRLPPRGVALEDYDKVKFVHPFWAIEREIKDLDKINCAMVEISVDSVMTASLGTLALGKAGQSAVSNLHIPALTNSEVTYLIVINY